MKTWIAVALVIGVCSSARAQNQGLLASEFAREGEDVASRCGNFTIGAVGGCAYTLFTDKPLHVSFGTLAPQNGTAFGPALVGEVPTANWRVDWSTDGVVAPRGGWRLGAYANFVHTKVTLPTPVFDDKPLAPASSDVYPVYSVYAQSINLPAVHFYAPNSRETLWRMRQTLVGAGGLIPFGPGAAGLALDLGATARFFDIGGSSKDWIESIEALPEPPLGAGDTHTFGQFSGGIRIVPEVGAHVKPDYRLRVDEFVSSSITFTRWTADIRHDFPFYRINRSGAGGNTPNHCSTDGSEHGCPAPSRGRYGTFSVYAKATGSSGDTVPFYLQPTLGGADINGTLALTAFPDYRFRGPDLLLLQATLEHSLVAMPLPRGFALPLGGLVRAETGRTAGRFGDVFSSLETSYEAGLTIRAGAFPEVFLLYARSGSDHRFTALINPALLGGGTRPSLF
jgi:hypothetical protein